MTEPYFEEGMGWVIKIIDGSSQNGATLLYYENQTAWKVYTSWKASGLDASEFISNY